MPFFKLVLLTNATGLDLPGVCEGLRCFTARDEVWAKLEVGTQSGMDRINRGIVPIERVMIGGLSSCSHPCTRVRQKRSEAGGNLAAANGRTRRE